MEDSPKVIRKLHESFGSWCKGPTVSFIVEGLVNREFEVAILNSGEHEVEIPKYVEYIHGDTHFIDTLEKGLVTSTFDYDNEDRVIKEYKEIISRFRELASVVYQWRHPYDHPHTLATSN